MQGKTSQDVLTSGACLCMYSIWGVLCVKMTMTMYTRVHSYAPYNMHANMHMHVNMHVNIIYTHYNMHIHVTQLSSQ